VAEDPIKKAEARRIANEALKSEIDLTRQLGKLLETNLQTSGRMNEAVRDRARILRQNLNDQKSQVSIDEKIANVKNNIASAQAKIAKSNAGNKRINVDIHKSTLANQKSELMRLQVQKRILDVTKKIKGAARIGVILAAAYKIAQQFAAQQDAIGAQFGSLNTLSDEFKNNLITSTEEVTSLGATIQDVITATSTLASNFGIGAIESAALSAKVIDTSKALGISVDEGANLMGTLMTTSFLSAQQAERLAEGTKQLAEMNNVSPDAVLRDMAASAETFALFSKDGGENIAKAAIQSRALGVSLDTTAKMAESLLDFESSITKEVEASFLIGRQLNLQKARELSLAGDLEGLQNEILKQVGSEAEFNQLNVIQRKALADALGREVSDIAKFVSNAEKANMLAGETAKSFQDIIGKDAMSELTVVLNELKIFGVAIANILGPPLMGLAKLVNVVLTPLGNAMIGLSAGIRGVDDFRSGPGGITTMAGPAGVFRLNPRDSVLATTNPIPVNDFMTGPPGSMGGNSNVSVSVGGKISGRDIVFFQEQGAEFGDAPGNGLM